MAEDPVNALILNGGFVDFLNKGMFVVGDCDMIPIRRFLENIMANAKADILALHWNSFVGTLRKGRLGAFHSFQQTMGERSGLGPNTQFALYPASKEQICHIVCNGFKACDASRVLLYPILSICQCVEESIADDNGIRHLLFCKVVMGKMGVITASAEDHDSFVDNVETPREYFIPVCEMNAQVLPLLVVSFKMSDQGSGAGRILASPVRTLSPQLFLGKLYSSLSKVLDSADRTFLSLMMKDFENCKASLADVYDSMKGIACAERYEGEKFDFEMIVNGIMKKLNRESVKLCYATFRGPNLGS